MHTPGLCDKVGDKCKESHLTLFRYQKIDGVEMIESFSMSLSQHLNIEAENRHSQTLGWV